MDSIDQKILVPYSAEEMFNLANNIEEYPDFLPWCSKTEVQRQIEHEVEATIYINYSGIRQHFSTTNIIDPPKRIVMHLKEGPFRHLHGEWDFIPIDDQASEVKFHLEFEFSSRLLNMTISPVFKRLIGSITASFLERAAQKYGAR